ncbi:MULTISPECIES: class I adenylate-forming enzyme family protein [unclassified Brevibacterium]|uniref:class I adenylate-forming enzyme family protein n=1 Tax=unclassified Brevibacterium TaxID=2614124 RepID=UPI0008A50EBD|nr:MULTISPECIES: long-chain fatty acid--CoA ligase [unclassified Brevibacterium]OFL64961.1 AMP-dependent synthetase [Brevibacterium sp. HMSC063G07]OFS24513.1 AMP-dependent synthetase [Brevibacterium sp. HMSC07C04]
MSSKLQTALATLGEEPAIVSGARVTTYGSLNRERRIWTERLSEAGVRSGDVVALEADYSVASVAALIALLEIKAITVPISSLPEEKREEILAVSAARFLITLTNSRPVVSPLEVADGQPSDLYRTLRDRGAAGLVLFSSGTTGNSKGSVLDFDKLVSAYEHSNSKPHRTITFLGFDHIGGVNTLFHALAHGSTIVTVRDRTPDEVLSVVQDARVEVLPTTPTFLTMCLIGRKLGQYDLSSLKVITYGTEPMPEHTLRKLHEALPGVRLKQTYGLSELGIMSTKSKSNDSLWVKLGGAGFEHKIVDGTLWVKSDRAMLGYLNAPYFFDEDGFFNTQDQVEVDGDYVKILGRKSEIINVGGLKVYPSEVESALLEVEGVADVLVSGHPNAVTGEIVRARIKPAPGTDSRRLKHDVRRHCAAKLEDYKVPAIVDFSTDDLHSKRFKKARA